MRWATLLIHLQYAPARKRLSLSRVFIPLRLASSPIGVKITILLTILRRFLPVLILTVIGAALAAWLGPLEHQEVSDHLAGFPDSHARAHELRPWILGFLCMIPAIGALYYATTRALDQYLIRQFLVAFALCFSGIYAIWLIIDLADKLGDFRQSEDWLLLMGKYYGTQLPFVFVELAPFGLLLGLLFCLGKLSASQEIVSMIQTGRGVIRIITPLAVIGFLASLLCLGFNYHWAPWAVGYKKAILEESKNGSTSLGRHVLYFEQDERRLWLIGSFPYQYHQGAPLRNVVIRTLDENDEPLSIINAGTATWERETGDWVFQDPEIWHLNRTLESTGEIMPEFEKHPGELRKKNWPETPWKLIKPGLKAENLGIPGLYSWLKVNRNETWVNKRRFLTQWHYRWAQPGICLAIVILAAPLGIVFTRRGAAGGIAISIFLCAGLMFFSAVFLSLGESGYLPPAWAAWGTNVTAAVLALILIQRRLVGRPIYQTFKKILPF